MRPIRWSSMCLLIAAVAAAGCGKDSNGPQNADPTANFTSSCTDLKCDFTDLSSDSDGSVASFAWQFGNGATAGNQNATYTYPAAGTYTVTLTVTDNDGGEGSFSQDVTVTAPQPGGPAADFTVSCLSLDCTFADQSTAGTSAIVTWAWNFGDGATSPNQGPDPHHYSATVLTVFTVGLTVTDNNGLTSTKTRQITVSPPASFTCGTTPDCGLTLLADAVVTVTLTSSDCTASGNTFVITAPVVDTLFKDGCHSPTPGTPAATFQLNNGNAFTAGTEVHAEVISGSTKQSFAPALQVTGSYPTWTVKFDDGEGCGVGDPGCAEPDFNDLEFTVTATPQ